MAECVRCGEKTTRKAEDYPCFSKVLGYILAPRVEIDACLKCGHRSVSSEAEEELDSWLKIREQTAICSLSAEQLLSAGQAAEMLGVTKQAFSKSPKVKKGHIYFTTIGNKKVYFRSSVELFKETGDGRYQISEWHSSLVSKRTAKHESSTEKWHAEETVSASEYTWRSSYSGSR